MIVIKNITKSGAKPFEYRTLLNLAFGSLLNITWKSLRITPLNQANPPEGSGLRLNNPSNILNEKPRKTNDPTPEPMPYPL